MVEAPNIVEGGGDEADDLDTGDESLTGQWQWRLHHHNCYVNKLLSNGL